MPYSSPWYLFFLLFVFLFYLVVSRKLKWLVLLSASYIFYAISCSYLIIFPLLTTCSTYVSGLLLQRIQSGYDVLKQTLPKDKRKLMRLISDRRKKWIIAFFVLFNLGLLLFLKYYNFFIAQSNELFDAFNFSLKLELRSLFVPLGISFYTLSAISYVVDVYRGTYQATSNIGKLALFIVFFPQITEGPIANYGQLGEQLCEGHAACWENIERGVLLILWGCFKKIVIADRAATFVSSVFDDVGHYSGVYVALATLLYTLQLYADFSGCIDIATGSARLFGVQLMANFRQPFFARSATEFWQRWHISLTLWFKNYIFYTVSLSRRFMDFSCWAQGNLGKFIGSLMPAASAMFLVWLATGLWHGANWKYAAYGLYYFVLILTGMLTAPAMSWLFRTVGINPKHSVVRWIQIIRTVVLVNIGMMLFRANSCGDFYRLLCDVFRDFALPPCGMAVC